MRTDVIVLGAGIVGVSAALHVQAKGRSVVLLDRRGAGEETSFGNAGLIQREGVYPHGFPQDFGTLVRHALNNRVDAYYHLSALPELMSFMARYWWKSRPGTYSNIARLYAPLIKHSLSEHRVLLDEAKAGNLILERGWIKAFRSERERDKALIEAEEMKRDFAVGFEALDGAALARKEPAIRVPLAGGIYWIEPVSVNDPYALTQAYLKLFESRGGLFVRGDATTLEEMQGGWRVSIAGGMIEARDAILALGPWVDTVTGRLGYRFPFAVKRGYHMHYKPQDGKSLNHCVLDAEGGYIIAPMAKGIRLTTGVEFARRDAPKTPVQLTRAEPVARAFFPLGERLDPEPWMGSRPCTPDMMPVIGPAPRHKGLWFTFGHAHHGLTLGPATGRLIAEMMAGETPYLDPMPYRAERFL